MSEEYDIFVERLTEFYDAKKSWAEATKNNLMDNAEKNQMYQQYISLKADWLQQKKQWQSMMLQYA